MKDVDIPKWLQGLPLAPEFRPTDTEFADPIAYISKIEKEASAFGICKVIPPLPKPSKKYVLSNLNRTLSKCPELGSDVSVKKMNDGVEGTNDSEVRALFTTRHQELGQGGKRVRGAVGSQSIGVSKQVWQSGELYTLEQFESKSKTFAKSQLGMVKEVSPLVVETMFWKASAEKPIYVEYANDVPGSGFGEPEGSFRYFNRQRRRRRKRGTFDRNNQGSSCNTNVPITNISSIVNTTSMDKDAELPSFLHTEQSQVSTSLPSMLSDQSEIFPEGKYPNATNEMHGTAGWKLSNSSWNLQVIARSPGSLTRYMPDDIPGVTSPMVYIGMLFSWFAWHVEDHELHSLNFLHMGSPKTWYSVPGDFASSFEEVIRVHAYGGNTNPLDALTLLGEKTTLVSPEVIIASGIPCCRLVQNPGEFVVTFPRAYHVGFSHGFSCGEAANFSTPKWLTVAKDAALRRAAMNYLPMLSHQQLLYLLTMSFISRVPRSLLPGARSSRLKDRQKEERELAVKNAFIEDILKENRLLTLLLQKNSSYRVVLWDLDLLPTSSKDSELCTTIGTVGPRTVENNIPDKYNIEDLCTQMSFYMDAVTDFYVDGADNLQNDYQVDSGTLPCVACGILGFPFMALVQPSEQASKDLLLESQDLVPQMGVSQPMGSESTVLNVRAERSVPEHSTFASEVKPEMGWNLSTGYLRPRLFCLEHAIQTVELLHPKGGANVLGICHSDFQKIKAYSAVVAEEISSPFTYNEISLGSASQEDLYLIDHAIDNQEKDECVKDWTSELNINLQHCLKMRKNFPSQKVKHALTLDGLFSDTVLSSNEFKWQSRKSRSKRNANPPILSKQSLSIQTEKVEKPVVNLDGAITRKQGQVTIQYYRKRYKSKPSGFEGVIEADSDKKHPEDLLVSGTGGYRDKNNGYISDNTLFRVEDAGNFSSDPSNLASCGKSQMQSQVQVTMSRGDLNENPCVSKLVDSTDTIRVAETMDSHSGNGMAEEPSKTNRKGDSLLHDYEKLPHILVVEGPAENHETTNFENPAGSLGILVHGKENSEVMEVKNILSETGSENRMCNPVETDETGRQCNIQADGDAPNPANSCPCADDSSGEMSNEHTETMVVDKCAMSGEMVTCSTVNGKLQKEIQPTKGEDVGKAVSCNVPLSSKCNPASVEEVELPGEMLTCEQEHNSSQSSSLVENKQLEEVELPGEMPTCEQEHNSSQSSSLVENKQLEEVELPGEMPTCEQEHNSSQSSSLVENKQLEDAISTLAQFMPTERTRSKRRKADVQNEDPTNFGSFSRSPCEGLRPRAKSNALANATDVKKRIEDKKESRKVNKHFDGSVLNQDKKEQKKGSHRCNVEGCRMSFHTKAELVLHMHNRCPVKGCGKKFNSHKYAVHHRRVHDDDRPLKCPWKGCTMTFKWAWARTEHIRVHTGERPYKCKVEGCGLTFRFVSDFSRHRRKTGHYLN